MWRAARRSGATARRPVRAVTQSAASTARPCASLISFANTHRRSLSASSFMTTCSTGRSATNAGTVSSGAVNGTHGTIAGWARFRSGRLDRRGQTLFTIHRESATTAYVKIFPPDRYRFDAQMRKVWAEALRSDDVCADRRAGRQPVGFATVSPGWLRNLFVLLPSGARGRCCAPRRGSCVAALPWADRSPVGARGERTGTTLLRSARLEGRRGPVEVGVPASSGRLRYSLRLGERRTESTHIEPPPPKGMSFEASARIRAGL